MENIGFESSYFFLYALSKKIPISFLIRRYRLSQTSYLRTAQKYGYIFKVGHGDYKFTEDFSRACDKIIEEINTTAIPCLNKESWFEDYLFPILTARR
jgi:hypothetical protein